MAVPSAITEAFQNTQSAVVGLAEHVKTGLSNWCEQRHYLFSSRPKGLDALAEKLESGRYAAWAEIDDRFACTVVVPTTAHEPDVIAFLDAAFVRDKLRKRNSTTKAPDVFRFDSTRWNGRLSPQVGDTVAPGADQILFEVQIQTVFENAWGVVTHDLVYKSDSIDWRKARLAAQLKAAVEQIEMTIAGFETNLDYIPASRHPETDEKVRLLAKLQDLMADGRLTDEIAPRSWSRLADNVYALVGSYTPRPQDRPKAMKKLCASLTDELRSSDKYIELRTGSLFQVILGHVAAGHVDDAVLDDFVIVDSPELRDLHDITSVPRPFRFDAVTPG